MNAILGSGGVKTWLSAVGGMLLLVAANLAQGASIVGSAHDPGNWSFGFEQEVCIMCHTPHNAMAVQPLWNHQMSTATYTLYSSPTMNAAASQPGSVSKLCLSCHDGTIGILNYGGSTGGMTLVEAGGANYPKVIGTDLGNDHPVGFTYDAALATADGGLVSPADARLVVAGVPLYGGKVECSTCHNVHDPALGKFLRTSNAASALCLKCHKK